MQDRIDELTTLVLKKNDEIVALARAVKGLPPDCDETDFSNITKEALKTLRASKE